MSKPQRDEGDSPFQGEPFVTAKVVELRRRPWLWIAGLCAVGLILLPLACGLLLTEGLTGGVAKARLVGRWIHVDRPPSRAAKALMSVGKVISDHDYVFLRFGTARYQMYRGSPQPFLQRTGTWQLVDDVNSAEDEVTVVIHYAEDKRTERFHIRFLDHETAEFRHRDGGVWIYHKVK